MITHIPAEFIGSVSEKNVVGKVSETMSIRDRAANVSNMNPVSKRASAVNDKDNADAAELFKRLSEMNLGNGPEDIKRIFDLLRNMRSTSDPNAPAFKTAAEQMAALVYCQSQLAVPGDSLKLKESLGIVGSRVGYMRNIISQLIDRIFFPTEENGGVGPDYT